LPAQLGSNQADPEEDLEVIRTAVTECPSKQNVTFYKPIFVTNRDVIKQIHDSSMLGGVVNKHTNEFTMKTQAQLLANLLVVLVEDINEKDMNTVLQWLHITSR
jgi:hypothetical protein